MLDEQAGRQHIVADVGFHALRARLEQQAFPDKY
jgi:hypothetical protein